MKKLSIIALIASVMVMSACGPEDPGLKDAYKNYFKIGVAVTPRNVTDSLQKAVILKEFNSITAENCMKPGEIHPQPGVWNFAQADAIANFRYQDAWSLPRMAQPVRQLDVQQV